MKLSEVSIIARSCDGPEPRGDSGRSRRFSRLSVREYPDSPRGGHRHHELSGGDAAIVETQVTKVLEESLSGIEGIDYLTSMSRRGRRIRSTPSVEPARTDDAAGG